MVRGPHLVFRQPTPPLLQRCGGLRRFGTAEAPARETLRSLPCWSMGLFRFLIIQAPATCAWGAPLL